jgi:hypothetical protein
MEKQGSPTQESHGITRDISMKSLDARKPLGGACRQADGEGVPSPAVTDALASHIRGRLTPPVPFDIALDPLRQSRVSSIRPPSAVDCRDLD